MSSAIALTHLDTYKNLKTLEKYDSLEKKAVWGFGVQGKKFVLVQQSDNWIKRIWFSFLKLIRVIKENAPAIEKLKSANITHYNLEDYRAWAQKENKLLASEIDLHRTSHAALKAQYDALQLSSNTAEEKFRNSRNSSKKKNNEIKALNTRIEELEKDKQILASQNVLVGLRSDELKAVITNLKPKFNFNDISNYIQRKGIQVIHTVTETAATVKDVASESVAAGTAAAARHAASSQPALG